MAPSFLPQAGQVGEILEDAGIMSGHPKYWRSRAAIVAQAKRHIDAVQFEKDGKTCTAKRAYRPEKGSGAQYITGGARIALDLMYSLFIAAPVDSLKEAIAWALEEAPLYAAYEYDLGIDRKTGGRRVGEISQSAYTMALEYFEASMEVELAKREERIAAKRRSERVGGFRGATSQTIGSLLSNEQKVKMTAGR